MIAFTALNYALGKTLGVEAAAEQIDQWLALGEFHHMPWLGSLDAIRRCGGGSTHVYYETACSHLGMARSRCFHWARTVNGPGFPRSWVSVDDDVCIDAVAAKALLDALAAEVPRVVVVPTLSRDPSARTLVYGSGAPSVGECLAPIEAAGFGCVGVNHLAIEAIAAANQHLRFEGEFGGDMLALFHDVLQDGLWYGEDTSFFLRVPSNVQKWAVTVGQSWHAGAFWEGGK